MSSQSPRPRTERVASACRNCRERKVKCSGGDPCKDCLRLRKDCVYPPALRRKRKAQDHPSGSHLNPLGRSFESVWDSRFVDSTDINDPQNSLQPAQNHPPRHPTADHHTLRAEDEQHPPISRGLRDTLQSASSSTRRTFNGGAGKKKPLTVSRPQSVRFPRGPISGSGAGVPSSPLAEDIQNGTEVPDWHYHEPWSWTSICSETGSKWIWSVTGNQDFSSIVKRFAKDLVQKYANNNYLSAPSSSPEIDEATTWEYVNAFYQNCWEADLGIIERVDFEAQLESHYRSPASKIDPAWFALRNIVLAGGYRSLLAKDHTVSFSTAQAEAGSYYKKALSVFTRLLLPPSNTTAIRALALMALYSEALGSPGFKYFLCSNAVHLAYSKGLYRQPDRAWGHSKDETLKTNWLWWAIYAFEKHIALCDSRPSAIDDDNVSAQVPVAAPRGSNIDLQSLSIGIRVARIQSQISRHLLSLKPLSMSAQELINSITRFHGQLKRVLQEMPEEFKIGTLARPAHSTRHLIHILHLHFSVYGSLMALHSHFFYPWMAARFSSEEQNTDIEAQIAFSSNAVAEAARKIILALRLANTNVTTPSWLALHYPIYAVINLFIYILKDPTLSTATADLGLLDVCAGHFGYIEFLTSSQVSISLPREAANVASKAVKEARAKESEPTSVEATAHYERRGNESRARTHDIGSSNFDSLESDATAISDMHNYMDMDATGWNLLSSFDLINSNASNFQTFP